MKTVIVGDGPAGYYTATKLAALAPDEEITLFGRETEPFYAKIRLPEYVADKLERGKLFLGQTANLAALGIEYLRGTEITGIDPGGSLVVTDSGKWKYDRLVLATGARPVIPPVSGNAVGEILTLRTIGDADALRERCASCEKAVIMGGGLLGLEAANALLSRNVQVTVIEFFPRLLPRQLNESQAQRVQAILEDAGLKFRLATTVAAVDRSSRGYRVTFSNDEYLECDFVLASAGVRSDTDLAQKTGLVVGKGIVVNERFETSVPGIYALGDCAETEGKVFGLWMAAMAQAEGLALILAGKAESFANRHYEPILKIPGVDMKELLSAP